MSAHNDSLTQQIAMQDSWLDSLRNGDATRWSNIRGAASRSDEKLKELTALVGDLLPTDEGAFVVFGSIARREFTTGSDLDWTIIIDGRADSLHLQLAHQLRSRLKIARFAEPGPTEVFGGLVFSHDLVHAVGGDEDTNRNMTRRLLLLLESRAIGGLGSSDVHDRIIRAILNRYVVEDASYISGIQRDKIPRFLLNDVIRFWRTMAVDYANKYRARAAHKWALRNIKLRMSRKLLFVSGFFMCISWALQENLKNDDPFARQQLIDYLSGWTLRAPLESLALVVSRHAPHLASDIFDNYDSFLALLDDEEQRERLENLSPEDAFKDKTFLEAREVAIKFDAALTQLMFSCDGSVTELVKKYGVF